VVLYLYLFSAVAGALLVGVSMLSGGSSEHSDGDGATEGDGEHALSEHEAAPQLAASGQNAQGGALVPGDHGHGDAHAPAQAGSHGAGHASSWIDGASALALSLFSLQLWTYLLAFGGITGLLLRWVAKVPEPLAGLCALGVGLGTAVTARKVLRRLSSGSDSGTVDGNRLVGSTAQVLIPAPAGGTGKVRLVARGQTVDLLARANEGHALEEGAEVLILDIKDGIADVTADLDVSRPALRAASEATTDSASNVAARAESAAAKNPPQKR
jgi:membrane protein implicated in regulation of membrane protease activity